MDIFDHRVVEVTPLKRYDDGLVKARFTLENGEEIEACVRHLFDDEPINDDTNSYEPDSRSSERTPVLR